MEATQVSLPFDALPNLVREEIFLHLPTADLKECQTVSTAWRDFIVAIVKQSKSYLDAKNATKRLVFGTIVNYGEEVEEDASVLVSYFF